jgi:hypothetical protein
MMISCCSCLRLDIHTSVGNKVYIRDSVFLMIVPTGRITDNNFNSYFSAFAI